MNELNNNNKIPKTVDPEVAKKDLNGDGHITQKELEMDLEFKRKELEDADARRDAMRTMTWFALLGMLFYPSGILITAMLGQDTAAKLIADIAPTYFVAISALVAAYFGANAYADKKKKNNGLISLQETFKNLLKDKKKLLIVYKLLFNKMNKVILQEKDF